MAKRKPIKDNNAQRDNGSEHSLDRKHKTIVSVSVILGCSGVAGAANAVLVPYFSLQNAGEKLMLWAAIMIVVFSPALIWLYKKYGPLK